MSSVRRQANLTTHGKCSMFLVRGWGEAKGSNAQDLNSGIGSLSKGAGDPANLRSAFLHKRQWLWIS